MATRHATQLLTGLLVLALAGAAPAAREDGKDKRRGPSDEATGWLTVLQNAGGDLKMERVVVVDEEGRVLDRAEGNRNSVQFPGRFLTFLRQPDPTISLIHNHPGNTGFSVEDLVQLVHPGVARVLAVGNAGSLYEARRGPGFGADFETVVYPKERQALERGLQNCPMNVGPGDDRLRTHFAHALALRLAKRGVIEYRTELDPTRQAAWDSVRIWFERIDR
jgi:hypothetical protein